MRYFHAMTTVIQLPPRPLASPADEPDDLRQIAEYGRHYKIRRWADRTPGEQHKIDCALSAFRTFRSARGELLGAEMWEMPAPDVETVQVYMGYLSHSSRPWRDASVAALRLYLLHIEAPALFRLVEAPLAKS